MGELEMCHQLEVWARGLGKASRQSGLSEPLTLKEMDTTAEKKKIQIFAETCPLYGFKKKTDNDAAVKR